MYYFFLFLQLSLRYLSLGWLLNLYQSNLPTKIKAAAEIMMSSIVIYANLLNCYFFQNFIFSFGSASGINPVSNLICSMAGHFFCCIDFCIIN